MKAALRLKHSDEHYMDLALEQAGQAALADEVPVGAVVVCDGEVVSAAYNRRESDHDPAGHAELLAIREASARLGRWRLSDCTVYVTLEPCPMCAGLMHQARIARCVFGAPDPKSGALGTLYALHEDERLNHRFEVTSGVREQESAALLRAFFGRRRGKGHRPLG
ncbi:MAG: tRNA adenosine(34) deaminase TadA [Actinobacteria bacterium]|nr:tRNA adenosine(34) deaminase TadA [Actinomycetota bacterium]